MSEPENGMMMRVAMADDTTMITHATSIVMIMLAIVAAVVGGWVGGWSG